MMYTTYDRKTGQITGVTNDDTIAKFSAYIEGNYNNNDYYIVNNRAIKYPPKPKGPSYHVYSFDYENNNWILNIPETTRRAKFFRSELLNKYVDKVNPIWLANMNAIEQLQVANYRQDLLDITDQPNFPVDIQWPIVPDILK